MTAKVHPPKNPLVPVTRLADYLAARLTAPPAFVSVSDGEHRLCRSCLRAGYGVDRWHPATTDFFTTSRGALEFAKCKACRSEVQARQFGRVAA